jgi:hypothetical protein
MRIISKAGILVSPLGRAVLTVYALVVFSTGIAAGAFGDGAFG